MVHNKTNTAQKQNTKAVEDDTQVINKELNKDARRIIIHRIYL